MNAENAAGASLDAVTDKSGVSVACGGGKTVWFECGCFGAAMDSPPFPR